MDINTFKNTEDSTTRGRYWADEAEALLAKTEVSTSSIPLLQGLLAMFCYEGNLGLGTKSLTYYFRAMDVYKALNYVETAQLRAGVDEDRARQEQLATSWCIWGCYCCEWYIRKPLIVAIISLTLFRRATQALGLRKMTRRPKISKAWHQPEFPLSLPTSSCNWWYPYPMSLQVQKSLKVEIREVDSLLSEVVEEALDFIYPDENGVPPSTNPQRALELYRRIVDWKQSCPSRLRIEDAVLPAAILLHISAEVMLIAILRPFAGFSRAQFGKFEPRERCYAHASNLASAIWTFRGFAIIRFEYWLNHALGTAAYVVIGGTEDAPVQMDTLVRACQCLHEMRGTLPLATDALCGIHVALKQSKEAVPAFMGKFFDRLGFRKDGLLHYSVAAFLSHSTDIAGDNSSKEIQLQELLDRMDDIGID
jgi:hypothetical protein